MLNSSIAIDVIGRGLLMCHACDIYVAESRRQLLMHLLDMRVIKFSMFLMTFASQNGSTEK